MTAWLGVFFLSVSWIYFLGVYLPGDNVRGLLLAGAGLALLIAAVRAGPRTPAPAGHRLLLLPFLFALLLVPFPYSLGMIFLAGGGLLLFAAGRAAWTGKTGNALVFSGLILSLQAAAIPLLDKISPRIHDLPALPWLFSAILRILGLPAAVSDRQVAAAVYERSWPLPVTAEALAVPELLLFFAAAAVLILVAPPEKPGRKRTIVLAGGILLAYAVLRLVFVQLVFLNYGRSGVFWNRDLKLVTLLPLVFFLARVVPLDLSRMEFRPPAAKKAFLFPAAVCAAAAFFLVAVCAFSDPGTRKPGRIVIDERHSDWEWSYLPFDKLWYGERSCYNYYCLAQYLGKYYSVAPNFAEITPELLAGCDVLILKTPTEPYAEAERKAIKNFVRNGGGLYLISDHTNTFGISAHLNPVAREFGFRFEYDATYDLSTGHLSRYRIPAFLPHPAVRHVPIFLFGTSCSLAASPAVEDMITGYGLQAMDLDYAGDNFFPTDHDRPPPRFGLVLQQAGMYSGRGRVLAFTDSTVFSNFWLFMPGKAELLLGSLEWVNRKNLLAGLKPLFLLAAAGALAGLYRSGRTGRENPLVLSSAAALGLVLGALVFSVLNARSYPLPEPRAPFTRVVFEQEHGDFGLPLTSIADFVPDNYFHTFYVWTQRLGWVPRTGKGVRDSFGANELAVLINPGREFSAADAERIENYLKAGGAVLLLDSARNEKSTAGRLLERFGLKLEPAAGETQEFSDAAGEKIGAAAHGLKVTGGAAKLFYPDGSALLAVKPVGKGMLAVFADAVLFTDSSLGTTRMFPGDEQRRLYDVEFWLLENLLRKDPASAGWNAVTRTASSAEALAVPASGRRTEPSAP